MSRPKDSPKTGAMQSDAKPAARDVPAAQDLVERIGDHAVLRFLGEGSTGRVYACRDARRGHPVAIKLLCRAIVADAKMLTRLSREGRAKAGLRSPHVASYYRMGEHEGGIYLVTELLEGESLAVRLQRDGPLSLLEAWRAARAAARGLKAALESGLRHRDVKPSNLFHVDGRVKVTDLGLARKVEAAPRRDGGRTVRGSAPFLAPEVIQGDAGDHRSDMYSLGCTLFSLLTGRPPFVGADADVLRAHVKEPAPYLGVLRPEAPAPLIALVTRLLLKDPAFRPRTYDELLDLIDEARVENTGLDDAPPLPPSPAELHSFLDDSTEVFDPPRLKERDKDREKPKEKDREKEQTQSSASTVRPGSRRALPLPLDDKLGDELARAIPEPSDEGAPPPVLDPPPQATPARPRAAVSSSAPPPFAPTGIVGSLKQMNVIEVVQTMEMGRKTASVNLEPKNGEKGVLAFSGGQLVFASYGAIMGEEAFYAMLPLREGVFRIHFGEEPVERNIKVPTQFLMLEGLRRQDEARGEPSSLDED